MLGWEILLRSNLRLRSPLIASRSHCSRQGREHLWTPHVCLHSSGTKPQRRRAYTTLGSRPAYSHRTMYYCNISIAKDRPPIPRSIASEDTPGPKDDYRDGSHCAKLGHPSQSRYLIVPATKRT